MSKKDLLLKKAKKKSPVTGETTKVVSAIVVSGELDELTNRIKSNVAQFERLKDKAADLKSRIAQDVLFIAQNKKRLLPERTLQDYIENDLQISKEYFYQIKRSYDFLESQHKTELIEQADFRIIDDIARIKDPKVQAELLSNIKDVTRAIIKEELKKCDRHTFSKSEKQAPFKTIKASFSGVLDTMEYYPDQVAKSKKDALDLLVGNKGHGLIDKMEFSKNQLQSLKDYIGTLIGAK